MLQFNSLRRLLAPALLLYTALSASAASAADSKWYRVDLLVFANRAPAAETEEQWRRDLLLRYPQNLIQLKTLAEYQAERCPADSAEAACTAASAEEIAQMLGTGGAASPPPYVLLEESDPEMTEVLSSLRRSSHYRPLFAGSWAQPMQPRSEAPQLLIRGGQKFDQHYELEGHLSIGMERYLHLKTDLWLTRFAPRPPITYNTAVHDADNEIPWPRLPIPFIEPAAEPAAAAMDGPATNEPGQGAGTVTSTHSSQYGSLMADDSDYIINRIVAMRQHRRMRSGELHFVDHPLFGLVIKISPIELAAKPN